MAFLLLCRDNFPVLWRNEQTRYINGNLLVIMETPCFCILANDTLSATTAFVCTDYLSGFYCIFHPVMRTLRIAIICSQISPWSCIRIQENQFTNTTIFTECTSCLSTAGKRRNTHRCQHRSYHNGCEYSLKSLHFQSPFEIRLGGSVKYFSQIGLQSLE